MKEVRKKETDQYARCENCPYKFTDIKNTCTQVRSYPDCIWGEYHKLMLKNIQVETQERRDYLLEQAKIDPVGTMLEMKQNIATDKLKLYRLEQEVKSNE